MTRRDDEEDYEVGYGKPPKNSRFKQGQSGNPNGRPKGAKGVEAMLRDTLFQKVSITENGKRKKITALEAFFRQTLKGALEGNSRAADKLLKLLPMLQASLDRETAMADAALADASLDDRPVLDALAELMGEAVESFFLGDRPGGDDA